MSSYLDAEGVNTAQTRTAYGELQQLNSQYGELAGDIGLAGASMLPPPAGTAADVVSIGRSLWKGNWGDALFDVVGLVPLGGDAIKGTRLANKLNDFRKALDVANSGMARALDGTKRAAAKYWDDITAANRQKYQDALDACDGTRACRELAAAKKGKQYESTPKSGKNGEWVGGERGDGVWQPANGSPAIPYKNGFPDYSGVREGAVDIPMRGNRSYNSETGDFGLAEDAYIKQNGSLPAGYDEGNFTWHHHENGVTMELVPTSSHSTSRHTGGVSVHSGSHAEGF